MRRPMTSVSLVLLLAVCAPLFGAEEGAWRVLERRVEMRDGVGLATTIHLPAGEGPWPVVLSRTPYGRTRAGERGHARFVENGFAYAVQDQRGRFDSEGVYTPHENEIDDGYDTVEWLAGQPWSTGRIGMTGASALGIATNLAACSQPPHLVAAWVVVAPESLFYEGRFIGGVFKEADTGTWMRNQGVSEEAVRAYRKRVVLDGRWRDTDTVFCRHRIEIPMYNVGGWYDLFSAGNIGNHQFLQTFGRDGARGNQKLMMGPFGHGAIRGDLEYPGTEGLRGRAGEELRWFDYWLKGIDNGIMDEPAVTYYQMAAARKGSFSSKNGPRSARSWPPDAPPRKYFYLGEAGRMGEELPAAEPSSSAYFFDPEAEPVPTVGGLNLTLPIGPMDQREIGDRPDVLRFETPRLESDIAIAGKIDLELWASSSAVDTDFMVKLVDIYPDGYEALVVDGALRARYRGGRRPEDVEMLEPERPTRMNVDLWHSAITFEKGHKIAVHIASTNHPRFEINPNTGEPPGEESGAAVVARNVVHHDAAHPTALLLPVVYLD